jgi:uncharacterized protein
MGPAARFMRSGLWRRLDGRSWERFELTRHDALWRLSGTILVRGDSGPAEARYEVTCDPGWRTLRTTVTLRDDAGERSLELVADGGRWSADGVDVAAVRGCVDVDLEWSPSTNTLPIRRLEVPVGGATGTLRMAWVRFPALTVEPLPQEYRRLAPERYHYTSGGGSFEADIEVDADSLVTAYEGAWERVPSP